MSATHSDVTPERIQQLSFAFAPPLLLEGGIRLGVFDALHANSQTHEQLASALQCSPRGMRILADALVGLNLLAKSDEGAYSLTPESATFLVSDQPEFQGGMFRHIGGQLLRNWLELTECVRTGKPATSVNQQTTGGEFFRQFVEDLFPRGYPAASVLARHLKIADVTSEYRVLDLAAGSGVWSIAAAEASPQVRVTAVDWSEVLPVTQEIAAKHGVADQYEFRAGDLLDADFGSGYQLATLGHILHSEGPDRSRTLLAKVFDALAPGGVIAIAEMVPDDDRRGPASALIFAANMLVHTDDGDTFTFAEQSDWLQAAGFINPRKLDVPAPSPLILADKPA